MLDNTSFSLFENGYYISPPMNLGTWMNDEYIPNYEFIALYFNQGKVLVSNKSNELHFDKTSFYENGESTNYTKYWNHIKVENNTKLLTPTFNVKAYGIVDNYSLIDFDFIEFGKNRSEVPNNILTYCLEEVFEVGIVMLCTSIMGLNPLEKREYCDYFMAQLSYFNKIDKFEDSHSELVDKLGEIADKSWDIWLDVVKNNYNQENDYYRHYEVINKKFDKISTILDEYIE